MRAEDEADGRGLGAVVDFGGSAVGVDVADLLRGKASVAQGHTHGACRAFGGGLRDVAGVGGHTEADDLCDGLCAASEGGFEGLEDQHGGAFAEGEATGGGGGGAG